MALIILPRNTGDDARAEAERKFKAAIEDPLTVLIVVYGEGPDVDKILEVCTARALVKAIIRRVVWVPDPDVLSKELKAKYWKKSWAAASIGLNDEVAEDLTTAKAKERIYVEQAFLHAEGQGGA